MRVRLSHRRQARGPRPEWVIAPWGATGTHWSQAFANPCPARVWAGRLTHETRFGSSGDLQGRKTAHAEVSVARGYGVSCHGGGAWALGRTSDGGRVASAVHVYRWC